ncbi:MAG: tetratricopeptide repeat protein, partial [Nitrospirota bacterium]|nr:tetratricopeptide repeat protein [Nitrospirota bacterium]
MKNILYTTTKAFCLTILVVVMASVSYADLAPDYEVNMSRGIARIDSREYDVAVTIFRDVLKTNPEDTRAKLMLGIALNRKGALRDAESTLRDVANRQHDLARTNYELGVVYYKQGKYSAAKEHFKKAEQNMPDPSLAGSIAGFNADIDRREHTKRFNLQATVGLQYDSNVTLRGSGEDSFVSLNSWLFDKESRERSDSRAVLFLKGSALITDASVRTEASYSFYQSLHTSLSSYNVQNHGLELKASYSPMDRVMLEARYMLDYTFLGSNDFSNIQTLRPSIRLMLIDNMPTTLVFAYAKKNFFSNDQLEDNADRSGFNVSAGVEQKIPVTHNFFLTLSYFYDNNNTRDGLASYVGNKYALAAHYDHHNL